MTVMLATTRDWFASAIEGVLKAERYQLLRATDRDELFRATRRAQVDAVILDTHIVPEDAPAVIRDLVEGPLSPAVPLLVYSSGVSHDQLHVDVLDAGAWDVIQEPVRSGYLLALLRRFLRIGHETRRQRERAEERGMPEREALLERLPVLEALARREQVGLVLLAVGLTRPDAFGTEGGERRQVANLCLERLRKSDLFGWVDDGDGVAIVAYAGSRQGGKALAERLAESAADRFGIEAPYKALSAGIVELSPDELPEEVRAVDRASGHFLSAAREALEKARDEGGGIRFAS